MKSVQLLYGKDGFLAMNRPENYFSMESFVQECTRQQLIGNPDVLLKVIFHAEHFLILPKQADQEAFFRFQYPGKPDATLQTKELSDGLQKIAYDIDPEFLQTVQATMPKHQLVADAFLFAEYVVSLHEKGTCFFAFHTPHDLQIFVANNRELIFANRYDTSSDEEKRYFILSVKHLFGGCDTCLLCNPNHGDDNLKDLIEPFFQRVQPIRLCDDHARPFWNHIADDIL